MRVAPGVSETARVGVIGSGSGGGCEAAPSSPLATSGGGKASGAVTKAGEVLARRDCGCQRRAPRSRAHPDRVVDWGAMRMGGRRAFGGCKSGPGGAAHAGELLSGVTQRRAAREDACGARACEHGRTQ